MSAKPVIYEEDDVPVYTLPELLTMENGQPVTSAEQWSARRDELVQIFTAQVYGKLPEASIPLHFEITEHAADALHDLAIRKQVTV